MLAQAVKLDIPHKHHLIVGNIEDRVIEDIHWIGTVTRQQLLVHARHPVRRVAKSLPVSFLPNSLKDLGNCLADPLLVDPVIRDQVCSFV